MKKILSNILALILIFCFIKNISIADELLVKETPIINNTTEDCVEQYYASTRICP